MGGIYVSCGSFEGNDKSCSPIEAVLEDLAKEAGAPELNVISRIKQLLYGDSDPVIIETKEVEMLTPLVSCYRASIAAQIAPVTDPFEQMERDLQANPDLDPVEAKYGKGLGWKYYCVLDLEQAFAVSAKELEPVIITWD